MSRHPGKPTEAELELRDVAKPAWPIRDALNRGNPKAISSGRVSTEAEGAEARRVARKDNADARSFRASLVKGV